MKENEVELCFTGESFGARQEAAKKISVRKRHKIVSLDTGLHKNAVATSNAFESLRCDRGLPYCIPPARC